MLIYSLAASGLGMEVAALASLFQGSGSGYTVRQPAASRQIIYGEQRVGGIFAYLSTTGGHLDQNNYVIVLAGHADDAIENLYLDGRQVFWAGGVGNVTRNGVNFGGAAASGSHTGPGGAQYDFGTLVYCEPRFGDQTDTSAGPDFPGGSASVIAGLTANDPTWAADGTGAAPTLRGCTYVYLKLEYDAAMFPNTPGAVEVKFTIRGKNDIWDPRTGLKGYSTNAALIDADVVRDTQFGLADVDAFQDAGSVAQLVAAANICDESVFVEATQSDEARYACHFHYDASVPPGDALATMLAAMGGRVSMPGGEWYFYPAAWIGPSFSFGAGDLAGPVQWNPVRKIRELFNRVRGTFIAANWPWNTAGNLYDSNGFFDGTIQNNFALGFEPTDFPEYAADTSRGYASDAFLEQDSQLIGPWDGGATYNLGDVVSEVIAGTKTMFKSLLAANAGNDPATTGMPSGPAPAYVGATVYGLGAVAVYGGVTYVSLVGSNTGNQPDISPSDWAVAAWAPYANLLVKDLALRSVLSLTQAQRLAKIELLRNRYQGTGSLAMKQKALAMQVCDVMEMTFGAMGWTDKVLEIVGATMSIAYGDGKKTAPREKSSMCWWRRRTRALPSGTRRRRSWTSTASRRWAGRRMRGIQRRRRRSPARSRHRQGWP